MGRALLAIAALALPACDLYFAPDVPADAGALPPDTCGDPPACMPTDRGATVCGRLVDLADARPVGSNVTIGFEDVTGAGEGVTDTRIDQCGYFSARGIDVPATGEVALFADDSGASGYLVTARRLYVGAGSLDNAVEVLALRADVDARWRNASNVAFTDRGALLATFRYQGAPVFGVSVGDVPTYAFVGTDQTRTSIVVSPTSGADGSLLIVPDGTTSYQPVGGLPSGCEWPTITPGWWTGVLWTVDVDAICKI